MIEEFRNNGLKADREIVFEAVKNKKMSYQYASEDLKNDPELKEIAKSYLEFLEEKNRT